MILEIGQFKIMEVDWMFTIIRILIIVPSIVLIIGCISIHDQNYLHNKLLIDVLDAQVIAQRGGSYRTMDRLFDLRNNSKDSGKYFVDLLDYYLGAAGGETLSEFITEKGAAIVPLLTKKRKSDINCMPVYQEICTQSEEHRNMKIDKMMDAIRNGIVLKPAE